MAEFISIGAAHWDVIGRAEGLAPGLDLPGRVTRRPGGVALNVAMALARAGRSAALVSVVGEDSAGLELVAAARNAGVDTDPVLRRGTTGYCLTIETGGDLFAAVADCAALEAAGLALVPRLPASGQIIADGNLSHEVLSALLFRDPVLVAASPAKAARLAGLLATGRAALSCNLAEAQVIAGRSLTDAASAVAVLSVLGAVWAVVTDGPRPAALADETGFSHLEPLPSAGGATGLGDAFLAALLTGRADGKRGKGALSDALAAAARHRAQTAP